VAESVPQSWLARLLVSVGLRNESATAIRTQTIAQIAGPAAMAPLFSLIGDSGATAISVSENGSKFAAGFSDGKIIVGSVAGDGKLIRLAGHSSTIRALQFGPREDRLVSAGTDHSIRIWDLTKSKAEVICLPVLVDGMAINVDGTVALASGDGKVTIFNIDAPSGTTTLSQDHKAAYAVAFSNDGALVASSGKDDAIFIRRLSDGSLVNRIVTGLSDLGSVSFSPDAKRIAAASVSGAVKVWDTYGDSAGTEIHAPPEKRWVVKFSGDGKLLALASWDGTARLFDGNTYQYLATIEATIIGSLTWHSPADRPAWSPPIKAVPFGSGTRSNPSRCSLRSRTTTRRRCGDAIALMEPGLPPAAAAVGPAFTALSRTARSIPNRCAPFATTAKSDPSRSLPMAGKC
jgi:WD40 repeat protein